MLVAVTDFESVDDGAAILANARALDPLLRAGAEEAEVGRRLTPHLVDALRGAGVFRMSMPAAWGGPEVDILTQVEIIEVISRAYASAGWCAMIGSDGGFYTASLTDEAGRWLYPSLDAVTAGYVFPVGRLDVVDGGFRLSGRWPFGSGCTHADVIAGGALVFDGGQVVLRADGMPERRLALLPATAYEILDTWDTTGLAGSGSHDYTVRDAFVPREHTFVLGEAVQRAGPLYAWPGLLIANAPGVPLGIARDAIDVATATLTDKLIMPDRRRARDEAPVRVALARAEAMVGSARSYLFDVLGSFWASLEAGRRPDLRERAALAGSYPHTFRTCVEVVQLLYETVGSAAIYRTCPLDRHLRDVITIGQHLVGQVRLLEQVGGMWFGLEPLNPIL
jgi:alkylation response protein AidB-like acyl-CoA dehydrogenase